MKFLKVVKIAALTSALIGQSAMAGNIVLTGHDVLFHNGQLGYDDILLDYLANGRDQSVMDMAVIGSGAGSWDWSTVGGDPAYNSITFYDTDTMGAAGWASALMSNVFVYLSHTSCGGCDTSTAGVAEVNSHSADIATAFNGGMDIWANSSGTNADYYGFLPAGVAASATGIFGSSGFVATTEGAALGISSTNINGFATHNQFSSFAGDFDVFETRDVTGGTEVITIGLLDGTIGSGGISTGGISVPEPATFVMFALGLMGLGARRLKKKY
jgi:hypothetical protein